MGNCFKGDKRTIPDPKPITIPDPIPSPNYYQLDKLAGHEGKITCIKELQNMNIITGSNLGELKIWNLSKSKCESTIKTEGQILCLLEFEPNMILLGKSTNVIELYDINAILSPKKVFDFSGHEYWVTDLAKCDNQYFASVSNDGDIRIFDYINKECFSIISNDNINFQCIIRLSNGKLCTGDVDSTIKIWDYKNKICEKTYKGHTNIVKCLCELNYGEIASGSEDNTIMIWKNNNEPPTVLTGHSKAVRYICHIKDYFIASASFDCTVRIWNLNFKSCIQILNGHNNFVTGVISHSNGQLISCSNDKNIIIWMKGGNY